MNLFAYEIEKEVPNGTDKENTKGYPDGANCPID